MSSLYNLEPQPTAKVVLQTTSGEIQLELFAKQTPLTSRNFLQLCLDGYYDNTLFHRLVPGFIIQGGDPTGTGSGGESSYDGGKPFADEFHSRLKFNRRGLLGMANTGEKDDNGSQFFLTLGKTEELIGRNTMFGRVVGDTIFNLVKMGEADLVEGEGSERPMYPTRILSTEILVNPFENMVKRMRFATRTESEAEPAAQGKKKAKKKAAKQLLSFAEDGDADGDGLVPAKTVKYNPNLVNGDEAEQRPRTAAAKRPAPESRSAKDERPAKRRISKSPSPVTNKRATPERAAPPARTAMRSSSSSESRSPSPPRRNKAALEAAHAQIASLKSSLKRDVATATPAEAHKRSALEMMIPATSTRGRKRRAGGGGVGGGGGSAAARDEQRALDEFNAFRRKLDAVAASAPAPVSESRGAPATSNSGDEKRISKPEDEPAGRGGGAGAARGAKGAVDEADEEGDEEEARLCDLHFIANCQSCTKWDEESGDQRAVPGGREDEDVIDGDDGKSGWLSHTLSFARDRLGKDLEWKRQNEKELVVIDPREKEREIADGGRERKRGSKHSVSKDGHKRERARAR